MDMGKDETVAQTGSEHIRLVAAKWLWGRGYSGGKEQKLWDFQEKPPSG